MNPPPQFELRGHKSAQVIISSRSAVQRFEMINYLTRQPINITAKENLLLLSTGVLDMSTFVRASKFRHVYCDPPRLDATYQNLRLSTATGEQNYIKANGLFLATGLSGGGGPFAVIPLNKPGKLAPDMPIIGGHTASVLDFDFNPFHDQILASASEDQTIKVWGIPEGGLTANINEPLVDLHGHGRKVTLLRFHPSASNVLASTSADQTVKLWDIEKGCEICSLNDAHEQLIQDIVWDYTGTTYTTSSKDKHVRIIDARTSTIASTILSAHEGAKSTKLAYTGHLDRLISVGFTRQSQRQFKIWDPRNLSRELKKVDIDQAAGVIMPFYDPDTNLLYLAGKGDGNVRFYEVQRRDPYCFPLSEQKSSVSAKGMAWVPKRSLNVMGCETARLLKLTTNSVEPLSFFVPRKSDSFQEDLYPDTSSDEAAHTADEWFAGSNKAPCLMSLSPLNTSLYYDPDSPFPQPPSPLPKSPVMLHKELDVAYARISLLESRLRSAGLSTS